MLMSATRACFGFFKAGRLTVLLTYDDKVARTHITCAVMRAQHKMHTDESRAY